MASGAIVGIGRGRALGDQCAILGRGHVGQAADEGDHAADLVLTVLHRPGGHAGIFDAVLENPEQLLVGPFARIDRQIGRGRGGGLHDGGRLLPRRAVAHRAAIGEMACRADQPGRVAGVVGRGEGGMGPHRIAHRPVQEPVGDRPVSARRGQVHDPRPGKGHAQCEQADQRDDHAFPGDADRHACAS